MYDERREKGVTVYRSRHERAPTLSAYEGWIEERGKAGWGGGGSSGGGGVCVFVCGGGGRFFWAARGTVNTGKNN